MSQAAVVILAAGLSRRAGPANKLLRAVEGQPMVRRVVQTALASGVGPCWVVLGHQAPQVRAALTGLDVRFVHNTAHEAGMGTSVAAGVAAVAQTSATAVLIALGDMPYVKSSTYSALILAFSKAPAGRVVLPISGEPPDRRPGNPTVWPRELFPNLMALTQDQGGRSILRSEPERALWCEVEDLGVLQDVDT